MKIIIDTNALIYSIYNRLDIVSELRKEFGRAVQLIVPNLVKEELERLKIKAKKASDRNSAKIALRLLPHVDFIEIELPKGHTDTQIIRFAKKNRAHVLTNDSIFRKKLKQNKIKTLYIRQKKLIKM